MHNKHMGLNLKLGGSSYSLNLTTVNPQIITWGAYAE